MGYGPSSPTTAVLSRPQVSAANASTTSSRFGNLADGSDDDENEDEGSTEDLTPTPAAPEIFSVLDNDGHDSPKITAAQKARLHLVAAKLPKLPAISQLVTLRRSVCAAFAAVVNDKILRRGLPLSLASSVFGQERTLSAPKEALRI